MNSSKRKGIRFEHDIVALVKSYGIEAQRAFSSDGRTVGWEAGTDLKFAGFCAQAKRRKDLPEYLSMEGEVNLVVIREDRGRPLALIDLEHLLRILSDRL